MPPSIFGRIESAVFSSALNVASDLNSFMRAVGSQADYLDLVDTIRKHLEYGEMVLNRVSEIAEIKHDPMYQNPDDCALAAYMLALAGAGQAELAKVAAELVATLPNLWWSGHVARRLLADESVRASVGTGTATIGDATHAAPAVIIMTGARGNRTRLYSSFVLPGHRFRIRKALRSRTESSMALVVVDQQPGTAGRNAPSNVRSASYTVDWGR